MRFKSLRKTGLLIAAFLILFFSVSAFGEKFEIEIFYMSPSQIAEQLSKEFGFEIKGDEQRKTIIFNSTSSVYDNVLKRVESIDVENKSFGGQPQQSQPFANQNSGGNATGGGQKESEITEYVFLNYLAALDIQKIANEKFGANIAIQTDKMKNAFIVTGQREKIDELKKFIAALDKDYIEAKSEAEALELPLKTEIFSLKYIGSDRMNEILLSHFSKCIISIDNGSKSLIVTDRPAKLEQIGDLILKMDTPEQEQITESIQIKYSDANNVIKILQTMYDLKKIDIDEKQKKIFINGPKKKIEEIKKFIENYDSEPPVILVEGTILSVNIAKAKQLGIKYEHSSGLIYDKTASQFTEEPLIDPAAEPLTSGKTTATKAIGEFTAGAALSQVMYQYTSKSGKVQEISLRALVDNSVAEAVLKPHITFVSGQTGVFEQNQNIPLKSKDANNNPITTIMSVGLTLSVGAIAVPAEITDERGRKKNSYKIIVSELKLTDGSREDEEASRETIFEAKQIVNDGQLIILGGAINDKTTKKDSKVPLLGDIPLIKYLFKYQDSTNSATEMLALLRLTVMTPESYKYKAAQFVESKDLRPIEFGGKVNDSIQEHPLKTAEWSSKIIYEKEGGYFDLIHDKLDPEFMEKVDRSFKKNIRGRIKVVQEWNNDELVRKLIFNDNGLKKAFEDMVAEFKISCYDIMIITRHLGSINDEIFMLYYEFLDENKLLDKKLKSKEKKK